VPSRIEYEEAWKVGQQRPLAKALTPAALSSTGLVEMKKLLLNKGDE
jgi:hypothetical protein